MMTKRFWVRKSIALAVLGFLPVAASAETKTFKNVNMNALELACLDVGGTITGTQPGTTGCRTKNSNTSCTQTGGGSGPGDPATGTCVNTGGSPARTSPGGRRLLGVLKKGGAMVGRTGSAGAPGGKTVRPGWKVPGAATHFGTAGVKQLSSSGRVGPTRKFHGGTLKPMAPGLGRATLKPYGARRK